MPHPTPLPEIQNESSDIANRNARTKMAKTATALIDMDNMANFGYLLKLIKPSTTLINAIA
jgi:hypothetical protein